MKNELMQNVWTRGAQRLMMLMHMPQVNTGQFHFTFFFGFVKNQNQNNTGNKGHKGLKRGRSVLLTREVDKVTTSHSAPIPSHKERELTTKEDSTELIILNNIILNILNKKSMKHLHIFCYLYIWHKLFSSQSKTQFVHKTTGWVSVVINNITVYVYDCQKPIHRDKHAYLNTQT